MAKKRKKPKIEFRYYQMSEGSPILALLGQKWVQTYGSGVNYLHFHNYLEIGYCYGGQGHMILGEDKVFFNGGEFTVIPPNYAHTTNSDVGTVSKWEYLFIDVEGFMKKILDSPVKAEKRRGVLPGGSERSTWCAPGRNCKNEQTIRRRQGGRRNRKSYKYDHTGIGLCFLLLYGGYSSRRSGEVLSYQ